MAGNTRGKLKEQFEGIHRNFDWIEHHAESALVLIAEQKPELSESVKSLFTMVVMLDKLAQDIYHKL